MKNLSIKISGEGTKEEIIKALSYLTESIQDSSDELIEAGVEWEDQTLVTVIQEA